MKWLLGLLVAALLAACGSHGDGEAPPAPRVPVGIGAVVRDTISQVISLTGRLVPLPGGSALLSAPADAMVRTVAVQIGERVHKGDLLVELDAPELGANAKALAATAATAEQEAARQQDLFSKGITSRKQVDEAATQASNARSAAEAAERLLDQAQVKSPLDGGIQRVLVHPGERVAAGAELVEVIRGGSLDFVAQATADQLARLKTGRPAMVTPEGSTEAQEGRVHAIAPAVDINSNAGAVVIRIARAGPGLLPGAGATARVNLGQKIGVLVVPDSALVLVGDVMSVFVVGADSVAHAHPVTVGVRQNGRAEVSGEIQAGDRVATTGAYGLSDGMQVVPAAPQ
ncbi:MAG TPA: efflux RND transporter periplasmic adaptor subunit [Gemmatimonadales bacterium]|nr:efflux RND transporter periplasmic adaptor subunit [Gemmatimonadales bacterium]